MSQVSVFFVRVATAAVCAVATGALTVVTAHYTRKALEEQDRQERLASEAARASEDE